MSDPIDLIRFTTVMVQDVRREGGTTLDVTTRRVAACACLRNPMLNAGQSASLDPVIDASAVIGEMLVERAVAAMGDLTICGYGKAALTGMAGDPEHGAAMIHVRLGGAMRRGAGGGPALIPGNGKLGPAGTPIDLVFGGIDDGWDYDAMDTMSVVVPDGPRPDEILLIVGYLAGGRPGARIRGASQEEVASLVENIRSGS